MKQLYGKLAVKAYGNIWLFITGAVEVFYYWVHLHKTWSFNVKSKINMSLPFMFFSIENKGFKENEEKEGSGKVGLPISVFEL